MAVNNLLLIAGHYWLAQVQVGVAWVGAAQVGVAQVVVSQVGLGLSFHGSIIKIRVVS